MQRTIIGDVPVFSYFETYDHGIELPTNLVGQIHSWADYQNLIPAPNTRVEIERVPEIAEIRIVKDKTGDYYVTADPKVALSILEHVDPQTTDVLELGIKAFPEGKEEIKTADYYRNIIWYDGDGDRLLPAVRHAGDITTLEEYMIKSRENVCIHEFDEFVGVEYPKTGDLWWATEEVKREVMERRKRFDKECEEKGECC
jgi:hypothetical protein